MTKDHSKKPRGGNKSRKRNKRGERSTTYFSKNKMTFKQRAKKKGDKRNKAHKASHSRGGNAVLQCVMTDHLIRVVVNVRENSRLQGGGEESKPTAKKDNEENWGDTLLFGVLKTAKHTIREPRDVSDGGKGLGKAKKSYIKPHISRPPFSNKWGGNVHN